MDIDYLLINIQCSLKYEKKKKESFSWHFLNFCNEILVESFHSKTSIVTSSISVSWRQTSASSSHDRQAINGTAYYPVRKQFLVYKSSYFSNQDVIYWKLWERSGIKCDSIGSVGQETLLYGLGPDISVPNK